MHMDSSGNGESTWLEMRFQEVREAGIKNEKGWIESRNE